MAQHDDRVPTISRVSDETIIELVYDNTARKTALVVSRFNGLWNIEQEVRLGSGELLVPYSANNNLIVNGCVLLASTPMECGHRHELLRDIQAFLHRYVDLSPAFELIAAHYILLAWVYDRFNELPYLRLRGQYGTGKTRALLAIGRLCYKPFFASGASTVSPIFYIADVFGGTLVLDEADLSFSDARVELVKILNNGHGKGMPVLRSVQNRHKEFNPTAFKVFGPKVVAMRESFQDEALESRFITEDTGARPVRSDIPVQLPAEFEEEALVLRNRLLHFRISEFFQIGPDLSALPAGLEPRLRQIALPLLSLADGTTRPLLQRALLSQNELARAARRETVEAAVLGAALATIRHSGGKEVAVGTITDRLNQGQSDDETRKSRWVGEALRKRFRIRTERRGGVYVIPNSEFPKIVSAATRWGLDEAT